jgi:hypothetical protein
MPGMMKNQPMKDSYVGGLEKTVADKMKRQSPYPRPKPPMTKPKPIVGKGKKIKEMTERMYKMPGR